MRNGTEVRIECPNCRWRGERRACNLPGTCPRCGTRTVRYVARPHPNVAVIENRPKPRQEFCAWAAGVIEGEGTVRITRGIKNLPILSVSVANTDRELLDSLPLYWGGVLKPCPAPKNVRHRQAWRWVLVSRQAAVFLRAIHPYLQTTRTKRRVELGLEFQAQKAAPGTQNYRSPDREVYRARQFEYFERMRRLNVRGMVA